VKGRHNSDEEEKVLQQKMISSQIMVTSSPKLNHARNVSSPWNTTEGRSIPSEGQEFKI